MADTEAGTLLFESSIFGSDGWSLLLVEPLQRFVLSSVFSHSELLPAQRLLLLCSISLHLLNSHIASPFVNTHQHQNHANCCNDGRGDQKITL